MSLSFVRNCKTKQLDCICIASEHYKAVDHGKQSLARLQQRLTFNYNMFAKYQ